MRPARGSGAGKVEAAGKKFLQDAPLSPAKRAELKKMLDAPIEVSLDENSPAPGPLAERFWKQAGAAGSKFVRSLFGTAIELPKECVEVHKKVIAQPIIQLGAYPGYTSAVADEVRKECVIAKEKIEEVAAAVVVAGGDGAPSAARCAYWSSGRVLQSSMDRFEQKGGQSLRRGCEGRGTETREQA